MLSSSFSPWPSFTQEEADAVTKVLLSNKVNYWTGNECKLFEKEFAEFADSKYAIAVANGTLALELALRALHVEPGDEVIVTPRSFMASASCAISVGAVPVFADIDRDTQGLSANTIKPCITQKTKAVIVVHLAGMPVDMDEIVELCKTHNLYLVEDCAQAHGAKYKGKSVGSIGHVSAWSFCQDKIMTTGGEGGMVTTNDKAMWSEMWSYKDHGKSWDAVNRDDHPSGFRWLHESFGSNYRMTEMQAKIGRMQLDKMPEWHSKRSKNASAILNVCATLNWIRVPKVADYAVHAFYKAYVFLKPDMLPPKWDRDRILKMFDDLDVPVMTGSCSEIYLEKAFTSNETDYRAMCPVSHELGETSLMFLVHPTLTEDEIRKTCDALHKINALIAG